MSAYIVLINTRKLDLYNEDVQIASIVELGEFPKNSKIETTQVKSFR